MAEICVVPANHRPFARNLLHYTYMRLPNNYLGTAIILASYLPILTRIGLYDSAYITIVKMFTDIAYISFGWLMISGFRQGIMRWLLNGNAMGTFHNTLGLWASVGLLIHPIGVALFYDDWTVVLPFLHPYGILVTLGSLALIILVIVVVSSHFLRQKHYDGWQLLHYSTYIFFWLIFFHALTSLPIHTLIGKYYFVWAGIVALTIGLKFLFDLKLLSFKTTIQSISEVATDTFTVRFAVPASLHSTWRAGQYTMVAFKRWHDNHAFSISRIYPDNTVEVTFKRLGNFSTKLSHQKNGTKLYVTGAYGTLHKSLKFAADDVVFIAGGIGITPYRSIVHDELENHTENTRNVYLIFCARNESFLAFNDDFTNMAKQHERFHYVTVCDNPETAIPVKGYFSKEVLLSQINTVENKDFFICGPEPMIKHILNILKEFDIPPYKIHTESFGY